MHFLILFLFIVQFLSKGQVSAHGPHDDEGLGGDHEHFHDSHGLRSTQRSLINSGGRRCGTKDPAKEWEKDSARIMSKWLSNKMLGLNQVSTIEVETYFHVITDGAIGSLSNEELQGQLQVLSDLFRPYGFTFILAGTIITDNSVWYYSDSFSVEDDEMKTALRVGDASTLNVYFKETDVLGYAQFPQDYSLYPKTDGVVLNRGSIPGGGIANYEEGKTLVHEVGHWLGLYHTFQPGDPGLLNFIPFLRRFTTACQTTGDLVDDTPRQETPTEGCPVGQNTCALYPGLDPINNYMDYSYDSCYSEFTTGQAERMWAFWNEYRA